MVPGVRFLAKTIAWLVAVGVMFVGLAVIAGAAMNAFDPTRDSTVLGVGGASALLGLAAVLLQVKSRRRPRRDR